MKNRDDEYINLSEPFDFIKSKKISPWFWLFTIVYFSGITYLISSSLSKPGEFGSLYVVSMFLVAPYSIIAVLYLNLAPDKKKKKK